MLERINKTAKAVSEKTGATISIQFDTTGYINLQVYPAGWHDARARTEADDGTASREDWRISRSSKHYNNLPVGAEGQAVVMEILEAML